MSAEKSLDFTATPDFYRLCDGVTKIDIIDQINKQLSSLDAMLSMTYGEQGETFRLMNDELQESYSVACSSIASECKGLFDRLQNME